MTHIVLRDPKLTVNALLKQSKGGVVIETTKHAQFALLPMTDEIFDFLLEHSPKLIKEWRQIQKRMEAGEYYTLEQIKEEFKDDFKRTGRARTKKRTTKHPKRS